MRTRFGQEPLAIGGSSPESGLLDGSDKVMLETLVADLTLKEDKANKGVAGGYASLDDASKVPIAQLPISIYSHVVSDDILEAASIIELSLKTVRFSKQAFSSIPVAVRVIVEVTSAAGSLRLVVSGTEVATTTVTAAGQYILEGDLPTIAGDIYSLDLRGTNVTIQLTEVTVNI